MKSKQRYRVSAYQKGGYDNFQRWDFATEQFVEESTSTTSTLDYTQAIDVFSTLLKNGEAYYYTVKHLTSYQDDDGVWQDSVEQELATGLSAIGVTAV
jgi:hypothetical protein